MRILGVDVYEGDRAAALAQVRHFLGDGQQHMIVTPNPEMLVLAQRDPYFASVLNQADLAVCDGKGLEFAGRGKLTRMPGSDFFVDVCELAAKEGKTVYLLGSGKSDVIARAASKLSFIEGLKIVGVHPGIPFHTGDDGRLQYDDDLHDAMMEDLILAAPDIIFVGFGHGKQEKWMYDQLQYVPSASIAMGVGGAFDFLGGYVKRAPRFIRQVGLEWLWRLIKEPRRVPRIVTATLVFPALYIKSLIK